MQNLIDASADWNIAADGVNDQTSALVANLGALGTNGWRGFVEISYNTKCNLKAVYAATPVGVVLLDYSSINTGQPPTYKNRFLTMYSGDSVSDDTQHVVASGHHPAMMLLNMGTAGTASAQSRFASLLFAAGIGDDGNPILSLLNQVAKNSDDDTWYWTLRLQTPYSASVGSTGKWAQGKSYTTAQYADNGTSYYQAMSSGVAGATMPTHTSGTASDGGVSWKYKGPVAPDTRILSVDETGRMAINGVPNRSNSNYLTVNDSGLIADDTETYILVNNNKNGSRAGLRFSAKSAAGTQRQALLRMDEQLRIALYDESAGSTLMTSDALNGFQMGAATRSTNYQSISGANPKLQSDGGYIYNSTAVMMTGLQLPGSQVKGTVRLFFGDGHTTLSKNAFNCPKNPGVDVTPPVGAIMDFQKDPGLSSIWTEVNRNF